VRQIKTLTSNNEKILNQLEMRASHSYRVARSLLAAPLEVSKPSIVHENSNPLRAESPSKRIIRKESQLVQFLVLNERLTKKPSD